MSFLSNKITIYPASKRNKLNYPHSRISTEKTITSNVRDLVSRSFIVEGLEASAVGSTVKITSGKAIIGGYYIDLKESEVIVNDLNNNIGKYLTLFVTLNIDNDNGNMILQGVDSSEDINSIFSGLKIGIIEDIKELREETGTPESIEEVDFHLPLAKIIQNGLEPITTISGQRLMENKYDIDEIFIKEAEDNKSTDKHYINLKDYLDNYYYLDDGDLG